uniref:Transcription factor TFIIB cyclin-like domain-containing protein n=1 Tax=viral metagenome TaxID=1070528 RepID=A0A6C0D1G4_9ZZZZ
MSITDYGLFDQALDQFKKTENENDDEYETCSDTCEHLEVVTENGVVICNDCGEEIKRNISHEKDWRYYGSTDTKRSTDPNRVQARKCEDRTIFKDVENMGFSEKIVSIANKIYGDVTKGQIFRGNSRKAIIFASIFHSFKLEGRPQSHEKLIKIFSLNRKTGLKGLKHVNLNAPKDSKIHVTYITPINLVDDIMDEFKANIKQKEQVSVLYDSIKNKSSKLNRSRPQSAAAGLIYFWICREHLSITLKEFAAKVNLSELTILKIAREISDILNIPIEEYKN